MWFFIIGGVLGVIQLFVRNPVQFIQANHPIQGAVFMFVVCGVIYGGILWLISSLIF